ncbi:hypothetical protein [Methylomarinum vadi]|uniref:hypothetical protein n=1 Tax=Methylomarinum vadi TaxID=438855 RepID=UPI0004DF158B|nr:hypothetical protein [Methylomarinum vadi]
MKTEIDYGNWEIHPHLAKPFLLKKVRKTSEMKVMATKYEGSITYLKFWNFWVRAGTPANTPTEYFFHNFESGSSQVKMLINAVGVPTYWPRTEKKVWNRIVAVWSWLAENVRVDNTDYAGLTSEDRWPSLEEYAHYFSDHHRLVWAACFSKAHLFASLLGRVLPRWHIIIATAHHTEAGAPPTASHVYVGVYLANRWYYLDPSAVYTAPLPRFKEKRSIGPFETVDYEHPFRVLPIPLFPLNLVPYLPA